MDLSAKLKLVALCALIFWCANNCNYTCRHLFHRRLQAISITTDLQPRKLIDELYQLGICSLYISINKVDYMHIYNCVYRAHDKSKY